MATREDYARPDLLADPEWLWSRRDDPRLRLVDCGSPEGYHRAHIPGAVRLGQGDYRSGQTRPDPWDPWLKDPASPLHVVKPDVFAAMMNQLGISDDTTVVTYDDFNGTFAARLWWVLTYYGHATTRVLNGGWQHWLEAGWPVTFRETVPAPGRFRPRPAEVMRIGLEELKSRHADPDLQVVNVLWPEMYAGTHNPYGNARVGHIPGSVNIPLERFFVDVDVPALKPAADLQTVLAEADLSPDLETIIHCQAGVRTTLGVFVASLLGWERVRAYDASLAEWANRDDTPLTTE
jgi:thiosulfate/3-mercaptopyruvate sulfurtransferase